MAPFVSVSCRNPSYSHLHTRLGHFSVGDDLTQPGLRRTLISYPCHTTGKVTGHALGPQPHQTQPYSGGTNALNMQLRGMTCCRICWPAERFMKHQPLPVVRTEKKNPSSDTSLCSFKQPPIRDSSRRRRVSCV